MRMKTCLSIVGLLAAPAFVAHAAAANSCDPFITAVPLLNSTATSAAVGDFGINCTNTSNVGVLTMNVQFTMTVPVLNTGGWRLFQGPNIYFGSLFGGNAVLFTGVQYNTTLASVNFDFSGLQVDPSLQPPGFAYQEFV